MIYSVLNQKGGVGKTTLSIHLAADLSRRKRRVLLIDGDPQGSSLAWSEFRKEPTFSVVSMPKTTLNQEIKMIASDYDDVVIDGPPRVTKLTASIILASDVVIIPTQPSPLDVWVAAETVDMVREAQIRRPKLKCAIVVNRRIANTSIGKKVRTSLNELQVPVLKTDIGQRVAFSNSIARGQTVLDQPNSKAAKEIQKFVNELRKIQ